MPNVKLKNLKPGMMIAKDVKNLNGRVLLSANQKLSEKHLKILKQWGINQVDIVDRRSKEKKGAIERRKKADDLSFPDAPPPELLSEVKSECNELFRFNDLENPVVKELYRIAVGYTIKSRPGMENFDVF